jgi:PAS domain S-box-containing protein
VNVPMTALTDMSAQLPNCLIPVFQTGPASSLLIDLSLDDDSASARKDNPPMSDDRPTQAAGMPVNGQARTLFQTVEQAKREWESTVDALPDLVSLIDQQGRLIRINRAVETWRLDRVEAIKGRGLHDLVHPACSLPQCYLAFCIQQALAQVSSGASLDYETYDPSLVRHVHVSIRPVSDRAGLAPSTAVVVIRDVSELKRAEQQREDLIAELSAFAHTVAHDLKNPLGLIVNYAEMLEDELNSADAGRALNFARTILRMGYKLNSIIDELLILAEARESEVSLTPLNMAEIVTQACQRLEHVIQDSAAEVHLPEQWPVALGYAPWVEEVWVNYISNAVKYGGQPPRIELGGDAQPDGQVRYWVRDNGTGLTPEMQAKLFVPFTRLAQARATGHGLGLSIVRRIIEKSHGQVGVESRQVPGEGCTFYFMLPAADV